MCLAYLVVGMRAYSPIYLHIIVFIILNEAEQLVSIQADVACKMSKSSLCFNTFPYGETGRRSWCILSNIARQVAEFSSNNWLNFKS